MNEQDLYNSQKKKKIQFENIQTFENKEKQSLNILNYIKPTNK